MEKSDICIVFELAAEAEAETALAECLPSASTNRSHAGWMETGDGHSSCVHSTTVAKGQVCVCVCVCVYMCVQ